MIYCTNCGTPRGSGSQFCTGCREQMSAASPTHPRPRGRLAGALIVLVLFLGGGGFATWVALNHDSSPPAAPSPPLDQSGDAASPPAGSDPSRTGWTSARISSAAALCVSLSSHDAGGTFFTYGPEKTIDNLPDTAWRCDGDGVGQRLEISFQNKVTLTSIGMIPGYAKTDPHDGTDRYAQNRRISAVNYTFDDGSTVTQSFDTSLRYRYLQTIPLPNVSTSHVTITILSSMSGEAIGGQLPFNKVAISEIAVSVR